MEQEGMGSLCAGQVVFQVWWLAFRHFLSEGFCFLCEEHKANLLGARSRGVEGTVEEEQTVASAIIGSQLHLGGLSLHTR